MDKRNVYVGYDNNLKRCLLYKKSEDKYIDIEEAKVYDKSEIKENTLVSYEQLIKSKGRTKRTIKKNFQKSENELLNIKDIYIGNINKVTEITNVRESKRKIDVTPMYNLMFAYVAPFLLNQNIKEYMPESVTYDCHSTTLLENRLLRRVKDKYSVEADYIDLISGIKITHTNSMLEPGDLVVPKNRLVSFTDKYPVSDLLLPKKKILSIYLENKKNNK